MRHDNARAKMIQVKMLIKLEIHVQTTQASVPSLWIRCFYSRCLFPVSPFICFNSKWVESLATIINTKQVLVYCNKERWCLFKNKLYTKRPFQLERLYNRKELYRTRIMVIGAFMRRYVSRPWSNWRAQVGVHMLLVCVAGAGVTDRARVGTRGSLSNW